jgi:hypothetical protein
MRLKAFISDAETWVVCTVLLLVVDVLMCTGALRGPTPPPQQRHATPAQTKAPPTSF